MGRTRHKRYGEIAKQQLDEDEKIEKATKRNKQVQDI